MIGTVLTGCSAGGIADQVLNLGLGQIYSGTMASSGVSLSAPQWSGASVFSQPSSFTPNDPLYSDQWHLAAVNIQGAWDLGYSGAGVTIGIVDDGVQMSHPDLNISMVDSYDFVDNDFDPTPTLPNQNHGTAVAGVAAATGNNSIGVIGPAYNARITGLKVDLDGSGTISQFVDATLYHSSSATPAENTIKIKNHSYGISSPYIDDAGTLMEASALSQSAAAGTIHVLSAGNESTDANWKRMQATDNAIVVSAVDDNGTAAYYSNGGANITVCAPSSGGTAGITTTDRTGTDGYNTDSDGDYTASFGGTSSSAPLVSGIMALGAEANPNLDVRTAKHLLANTSTKVDSTNSAWTQNAAGVNFNPYYGFGQIDAGAFVEAAEIYTGVTERISGMVQWTNAIEIADRPGDESWLWGNIYSVTVEPSVFSNNLEEIILTISMEAAEGSFWTPTELTIDVLDPYGNQLTAVYYSTEAAAVGSLSSWDYVVNGFWGEDPTGQWLVGVGDGVANGQTGTVTSLAMTFNTGDLVPEPGTWMMITLISGIAFWIRRRFYD